MEDWPYYQLCNKYEAFPTKPVQEALLMLLTDEEEVLQLRLRCFMALAYQDRHNRDRVPLKESISKYGYDALYTLQEEFNNPSISAMFFNVFLTTLVNEEEYLDDRFLIIGDIDSCSETEFKNTIYALKKIAFKMGLPHLRFHTSSNTWGENMFKKQGFPMEVKYPVGGINFTTIIPLEKLKFTGADNDTF
jgi:hypothetical protein